MTGGLGRLPTPLGDVVLAWQGKALCVLDFADNAGRLETLVKRAFNTAPQHVDVPRFLSVPLANYFSGDPAALDTVPVAPAGSAFQQRVWSALRRIPPGTRWTYAGLARHLAMSPGSARAVGRANALNPVSLVIPCHRLTGTDGTLTGYAGGLARKEWLLRHEEAAAPGDGATAHRLRPPPPPPAAPRDCRAGHEGR